MKGTKLIYSYRRLGLVSKPLAIYTSGGVEKGSQKGLIAESGVKTLKTRQSEAKIKRNPDGTTTVVYPDSDDEEGIPVNHDVEEPTPVVKGLLSTLRSLIGE